MRRNAFPLGEEGLLVTPSKKERPVASVLERATRGLPRFFVSFWAHFPKAVSFFVYFQFSRCDPDDPEPHFSPQSLFARPRTILCASSLDAGRCFVLLLCAPKLAWPWYRACEAGPSPIELARPACSSWPLLLSARVEHEPVGTQERPPNEPAVARCLLHHVMFHSARSYTRRNIILSLETAIRPSA